MSDWLELLRAAIAEHPRGAAGVADELGYSRPAISRVINSRYGDTTRIAQEVVSRYGQVHCPALGELPREECRRLASRTYSAITPDQVDMWRSCRRCPINPYKKGE